MDFYSLRQRWSTTKLWSALEFIRIFNMTMPFTSGFVGVVLASEGVFLSVKAVSGMFIPVFLWAGGQVFNDLFDLDVDRINTPYRAVPSGRFSLRETVALGGGLTLVGMTLSVLTGSMMCQVLTICAVVMSNVYSYILKRKGISGHINFAFCVLLCIYIGQSAVSGTVVSLYAPLGVFLYHVSINIMASVGDIRGDKKTNVVTLPVQLGGVRATYVASLFWAAGIVWSAWGAHMTVVWLVLISLATVISVYNTRLLFADPSPANATTALRLFRLGTILLQLSLVVEYLNGAQLAVLASALGVFTVVTFVFFETPKGIRDPFKGVASHG